MSIEYIDIHHCLYSRRFTQSEKDLLLSMHKYRCSVIKDYRFCVSYAAYLLGDRCIREITHVWTYLNPDIQKSPFTPEEDAIILLYASRNSPICWATLATSHLPERSAVQCRQRYFQLIKPRPTENTEQTKRKVCLKRLKMETCIKNPFLCVFREILVQRNISNGLKNNRF